jgi:sterol desaturase/sphingolipid hydroxylase (fatty acid hydroxylase superfamily)
MEPLAVVHDTLSAALYATAVAAIVVETLVMQVRGVPRDRKSRVLGLKCGALSFGVGALFSVLVAVPLMQLAYAHRLLDAGFGVGVWIMTFFVNDLMFYVSHRLEHRVRALWAVHTVHHSSRHFDLTAGVRGSVFDALTKLPFTLWIPLVLGVHPLIIVVLETAFRFYGLAYHTEAVGKLGVLDRILVTPSNHRAHHGSNARYLDCNFGGFFILWDRLFGTYRAETERVRYGLVKDWHSYSLADAQLHELRDLARDVARAPSFAEKARVALGPPGAH